jgi:hypothetical protein
VTAAQNITQLFTGYKWPTTTITYTFITEYAPYTPQGDQEPGGPIVLSAAQQAATRQLFADVQSFLGVQFVEVTQDNGQNQIGQIAIGMRNNLLVPSWVGQTEASLNIPGLGGDIWIKAGSYGDAASNEFVSTMLHEIGHALGLDHPTFADAQSKALHGHGV